MFSVFLLLQRIKNFLCCNDRTFTVYPSLDKNSDKVGSKSWKNRNTLIWMSLRKPIKLIILRRISFSRQYKVFKLKMSDLKELFFLCDTIGFCIDL